MSSYDNSWSISGMNRVQNQQSLYDLPVKNKQDQGDVQDQDDPNNNQDKKTPTDEEIQAKYNEELEKQREASRAKTLAYIESLPPPPMDTNLSMSRAIEQTQDALMQLARVMKQNNIQLDVAQIQANQASRKESLDAAGEEQKVSLGKAITGSVLSVGFAMAPVGLNHRKVNKAEERIFQENTNGKVLSEAEKLEEQQKARKAAAKENPESLLGAATKGLSGSANPIAEAAFSAKEKDVKTKRAEADSIKSNQEMLMKLSDRAQADYEDARKRVMESIETLVHLHLQEQQAATWKT